MTTSESSSSRVYLGRVGDFHIQEVRCRTRGKSNNNAKSRTIRETKNGDKTLNRECIGEAKRMRMTVKQDKHLRPRHESQPYYVVQLLLLE